VTTIGPATVTHLLASIVTSLVTWRETVLNLLVTLPSLIREELGKMAPCNDSGLLAVHLREIMVGIAIAILRHGTTIRRILVAMRTTAHAPIIALITVMIPVILLRPPIQLGLTTTRAADRRLRLRIVETIVGTIPIALETTATALGHRRLVAAARSLLVMPDHWLGLPAEVLQHL